MSLQTTTAAAAAVGLYLFTGLLQVLESTGIIFPDFQALESP